MSGRLLILVALYLCYRGVKYLMFSNSKTIKTFKNKEICDSMIECKKCGTYIPENEAIKKNFHGKNIYFCSKECEKSSY